MSTEDAIKTHFKNRKGFKFKSIPKSMRPTAESMKKMGERIDSQIKSNNAIRNNSIINTSKRFVD